jgi:hypothetical protein
MPAFSRQDLQQRINTTLYANASNDVTPQAVNSLLQDMLASGYVAEDMFPAFSTAAGRVGDTFRYQFSGDAVPSLFLVVQNVASKPTPTPAAQPQYVRLTQPGGGGGAGAYLPLTGNSDKTPLTGPLYLGKADTPEVDGSIVLYDNENEAPFTILAHDGLQFYYDSKPLLSLQTSGSDCFVPLMASNKALYDEQWNADRNLYVARHKLEEQLAKPWAVPRGRTMLYQDFVDAFKKGIKQVDVGTLIIDDKTFDIVSKDMTDLPFRTLSAAQEKLLQSPLRLINTGKTDAFLYNGIEASDSEFGTSFTLSRYAVTLTPSGSWIDFVWAPTIPGGKDSWYMMDAHIFNSPDY